MPARADFYASLVHYADHLAPIWAAIREDRRGGFWCPPKLVSGLRARGIPAVAGRPPKAPSPVVVAGFADMQLCRGRPQVLVEHGAGQAYEAPDPSYSGGPRRDTVVLFLCPNEISAERNREAYPGARVEVVGSPRVDQLRCDIGAKDFSGNVTAALSFHWSGPIGAQPEATWALPHFERALPDVVAALQRQGIEVLGHGHPRMRLYFAELWRRLGIEHVPRFDDVADRAGVYVCDNSSTMYEFAALGRPVVVLNSPAYRRGLDLWPRFWRCADVGVQVDRPEDLEVAIRLAIEDPPAIAGRRAGVVAEVYPLLDGRAAQRSAEAILEVVGSVP